MKTLALPFVIVLLINLMPAFAPPTLMAMSWVGFNSLLLLLRPVLQHQVDSRLLHSPGRW
ncbi:hypothetical protein SAMN05421548_14915 [Paraburkholderia lycopersici]|uniref:Uncharacterized protein n=1 Tax=Paraburkholderia lycopersici TaxID=416944 RepID=A0A1G7CXN9_9BURK|nr:hypothetical protein SAMN05421548_14915 [Paraburkholderia lycopersici]